jgi:Immunity protein Imm5
MAADGLPPDLEQRIAEARSELEARDDGRLPLPQRRRVREAFGPEEPLDAAAAPPGLRRRVELARLAAERVMPVWYAEAPGDHGPEEMLVLADRRLNRQISAAQADDLADQFRVHADRLASRKAISQRALAAGEAARLVLVAADLDDYAEYPPDADDGDIDPDNWEAAYVAAIAAAGYPEEDASVRRDFWRWYLDEAVPKAWGSG